MLDEPLQEQAALFAAGALTAVERDQFELVLHFHTELRTFTTGLLEAAAAASVATLPAASPQPSDRLKARIFDLLDDRAQQTSDTGLVMTNSDGLVEWINPVFTEMCGYTLEELRGRKLGRILQGEKTDLSAAARMRDAVLERRACQESILNYHKNGQPYWVQINIEPIFCPAGELRWFVAREREVEAQAA